MAVGLHENITKIVGIGGACGTAIAGLWTAFTYVSDAKSKFESSQDKISQLERTIEEVKGRVGASDKTLTGPPGGRGERGERGPEGPIGPEGPKGEAGLGRNEIQKIVDQAIAQNNKNTKIASADGIINLGQNAPSQQIAIPKGCMSRSQFQKTSVMLIKVGSEFCSDDGELLSKVTQLDNGYIFFWSPGAGGWQCNPGSQCSFSWQKDRRFYFERWGEDTERGAKSAQIRIKPNI